jgi:hypothetical protein
VRNRRTISHNLEQLAVVLPPPLLLAASFKSCRAVTAAFDSNQECRLLLLLLRRRWWPSCRAAYPWRAVSSWTPSPWRPSTGGQQGAGGAGQ